MKWRLYRLPGDREWWRIDHGAGSLVLFAKRWKAAPSVEVHSEDASDPATMVPRAWIALGNCQVVISDLSAEFLPA
ncbi:MAG: hypothetical protein ACRD3S_22555 [Terracidiphilus sp.]